MPSRLPYLVRNFRLDLRTMRVFIAGYSGLAFIGCEYILPDYGREVVDYAIGI